MINMTISWYGEACFLLEGGGVRILIEPPQKESGINSPRLKSDILIYSKSRDEKNSFTNSGSEAFIIDSPGEYEIKGVDVRGIVDPSTSSGPVNIIYNIEIDEIKMTHLGFTGKKFDNAKLAELDDPDVVFMPVGGGDILDAEGAMGIINQLEPSIAIPMLYDVKGLKIKRAPLLTFLKESEAKELPQPKLTIKKKDLTEEETKIVILEKS